MPSAAYKHPVHGVTGALVEALVNATGPASVRRGILSRLPFVQLRSDVRDVVYLTWLVPIDRARLLAPASVELQQWEGLSDFTILSYAHGRFGPSLLGPLRRFLPSPLQSNWRLYLSKPPPGAPDTAAKTVLFTHNIMNSLLHVIGARAFSDALPAHLPAQFLHAREGGTFRTQIQPGLGSAPAFTASVQLSLTRELPPAFQSIYGTWSQAITELALQDAAVVEIPDRASLAFARIDLPIDVSCVRPAELVSESLHCPVVEALAPIGHPLCFVVPQTPFTVCSEKLIAAV